MSRLDFICLAGFVLFVIVFGLFMGWFDAFPWSRVPALFGGN